MPDTLTPPFSREEMEAIRRAARQDEREGTDAGSTVRRGFWKALRRVAANLPFCEDLIAAFYCATDAATPRRVRFILFGALAYFIMPLDTIPDIWPVVGFTDDAAVLAAAMAAVASAIQPAHRERAREWLKTNRQ